MTELAAVTAKVADKKVQLTVSLDLPKQHLNAEAPNGWTLSGLDDAGTKFVEGLPTADKKGNLVILPKEGKSATQKVSLQLSWPEGTSAGSMTLDLALKVFICMDEEDVCLPPKAMHFSQPLKLV